MEVLPAPLGPMIASSSPSRTSNETSSSATSPLNASVSPSTRSRGGTLAQPPLLATVVLHLAIGAALALGEAEVELAHVVIPREHVGRPVHHHLADLEDVPVRGEGQRKRGILLDEQDRRALAVDLGDRVAD